MGAFKFLDTILSFIKNNQKLILVILLIFASITAYAFRNSYLEQKRETEKQIQNIEALSDSVRTYKTENGDLVSEKLALQSDKEQLRTLNSDLADEIENYKGEITQLTQLVTDLRADTGDVDTTYRAEIGLGTYKFTWEKTESGDRWSKVLEGYFVIQADTLVKPTLLENKITKDNLNMEVITGISENRDGQPSIFVRSTYPNLTFTDINGAIIEERKEYVTKPKRWGIGPNFSYGMNGNGETSAFAGIGIQYNFIRF